MPPSKKTSTELLAELYGRAGDPPCTVLAMATPAPMDNARAVARVLVGGVASRRVEPLARALDAYVAADRSATVAARKSKAATK